MRLYGEIAKVEEQDDGSIKVFGVASAPVRDSHGEVVTADAMAKAIDGYMAFPAVREMHDATKAAGRALELGVDDDGVTNIVAHVVDPLAITKVKSKVYAGFSIGARVKKRNGLDRTIIEDIDLVEVSLVDRPSCPDATVSLWKADVAEEEQNSDHGAQPADDDATSEKAEETPASENVTADVDAIMKAINANLDKIEKGESGEKEARIAPECLKAGIDLRKGIYGVNRLGSILSDLAFAIFDADCEAQFEGDDSPVPAKLRDAFNALVAAYKAMSDEEIAELTTQVNGESLARAATVALTDLAKTEGDVPCGDILGAAVEPLLTKGVSLPTQEQPSQDDERLAKAEAELSEARAAKHITTCNHPQW